MIAWVFSTRVYLWGGFCEKPPKWMFTKMQRRGYTTPIMQEQAPKNEKTPDAAVTKPQGTVDPIATALAERLAKIQEQIFDINAEISNEKLAELREIKKKGQARLAQLAAEGKVPGEIAKSAPLSLVKKDGGVEVREVRGAEAEKVMRMVEKPGVISEDVARNAFDGLADLDRLDRRRERSGS